MDTTILTLDAGERIMIMAAVIGSGIAHYLDVEQVLPSIVMGVIVGVLAWGVFVSSHIRGRQ